VLLTSKANIPVVVGLGTDIVEIARIAKMIERHAETFINRIYTPEEIKYCQKRKHCYEAFAGRWAAKEAIMKVLGTGFVKGIGWLDIEILNEKSGQPFVNIRGGAGEYAEKIGIDEILITISHCKAYATATAIGIRNDL
jgi:holo-[acyl-carrier protein] synthase